MKLYTLTEMALLEVYFSTQMFKLNKILSIYIVSIW
jgi:hypothetical protein